MKTNPSTEELFALAYPGYEMVNDRIGEVGSPHTISIKDAFGLMMLHNLTVAGVLEQVREITYPRTRLHNELNTE